MAYATRADLRLSEELLAWLTADGAGAVPDDARIAQALLEASQRIDRAIGQRYSLPWDDTDGQLKELCVALARHGLYLLRPDGPEIPESIKAAKAEAERDLREIRDGRLSLAGTSLAPAPGETAKTQVRAPARVFGADVLDKYR